MCTWAHADRFFPGNFGNVTKLEVKAAEQAEQECTTQIHKTLNALEMI